LLQGNVLEGTHQCFPVVNVHTMRRENTVDLIFTLGLNSVVRQGCGRTIGRRAIGRRSPAAEG